jgi:hypothetical protein
MRPKLGSSSVVSVVGTKAGVPVEETGGSLVPSNGPHFFYVPLRELADSEAPLRLSLDREKSGPSSSRGACASLMAFVLVAEYLGTSKSAGGGSANACKRNGGTEKSQCNVRRTQTHLRVLPLGRFCRLQ